MKKKVYIGFSGGVDSSVSAYLLKKQNYDVTAIFIDNLYTDTCAGQCMQKEIDIAKQVANSLDIPLHIWDFKDIFKDRVIDTFIDKYKTGSTPNPCIECNKIFKFGIFAQKSFDSGADYISTGHYCITKNGHLYKGIDPNKDQSYFLHDISSNVLEKTLFPVGNMNKEKVREIAKDIHLPNKEKKDSQKICFLKGTNVQDYLSTYIETKPGNILDTDTKQIVGTHEGIFNYTLGQRKGIKVGGLTQPYFVSGKDLNTNTLYVANSRNNPKLWKNKFIVNNFSFIHTSNSLRTEDLKAVIRYHSREVPTTVIWEKDNNVITGYFRLKDKVWTPSVGQSLVLYHKNECIGGGEISEII